MVSNENRLNVYNAPPVEMKFDIFYDIYLYYFNLCFPKITHRKWSNYKSRWLTIDLCNMQHELRHLTEPSRSSHDPNMKITVKNK